MDGERLLTSQQAAEKLGCKRAWVNRLIESGRLPAVKFGRSWRIKESDLPLVENLKVGCPKGTIRRKEVVG